MVDMAHFAGLVAAGLHPSPVPHAHVVTSTTHKTLGGPRGGVILAATSRIAKKLNSAVFPGQQGGPLEHVIAAKAVTFKLAAGHAFRDRQCAPSSGARLLADRLLAPTPGRWHRRGQPAAPTCTWSWSTYGTQSLTASRPRTGWTGRASPSTATPCRSTPGRRWSAPASADRDTGARRAWPRRGRVREVADIVAEALRPSTGERALEALRDRVAAVTAAYPLYPMLKETWR